MRFSERFCSSHNSQPGLPLASATSFACTEKRSLPTTLLFRRWAAASGEERLCFDAAPDFPRETCVYAPSCRSHSASLVGFTESSARLEAIRAYNGVHQAIPRAKAGHAWKARRRSRWVGCGDVLLLRSDHLDRAARAGGHRNWKDRYFVYTDHLYYYPSQQVRSACRLAHVTGQCATPTLAVRRPTRRIPTRRSGASSSTRTSARKARMPQRPLSLLSTPTRRCAGAEGHAPPPPRNGRHFCAPPARPQSLTLKAGSVAEMEGWIAAIMAPLVELSTVPGSAPEAAAGGAAAAVPVA